MFPGECLPGDPIFSLTLSIAHLIHSIIMNDTTLIYCGIIFLAAFLGGILTLVRKWSEELLHLFLSFGAGIFLGAVFLHLLPEALSHEHADESAWFIMLGFVLVFFVEKFLLIHTPDKNGKLLEHKVASVSAMVGLSVHSLVAGFGLAVGGASNPEIGSMIFYSILAHKTTAAFSLVSLFLLARISTRHILGLLLLFSLMTPTGALLFAPMFEMVHETTMAALLGLTTGTFLYVATGELLPEVFHTRERRWLKLTLMITGIIIMGFLGGASHSH